MKQSSNSIIIQYAFFTAVATTVYFLESMAVRALPLPFLRIGLANVVIVYLLLNKSFVFAFTVNIMKTLIGGLISMTLLSPATLLSLSGGIISLVVMWLLLVSKINFSIIGISIAGAVVHNIVQILCVRWLIIPRDSILYLIPVLMLIGIATGFVTGIIAYELSIRLEGNKECVKQAV
jgi:heptaprenyl diphosphate synthase